MFKNDFQINQAAQHYLPNGLKVIHYLDASNPLICIQLHIKVGSAKENDYCRGYSHFIEHLTFKSTVNYPQNLISEIVPKNGGSINAYTDFDSTCYYLMMPSEKLELSLKILSELAFRACFTPADVKIEKDIIIEEIKQYENDPEGDFGEYIQQQYFRTSPLKYPVLGTVKSVSKAGYKDLLQHYKTNYVPSNAFVTISGSYYEEELLLYMDRYFGPWMDSEGAFQYQIQDKTEEVSNFRMDYRYRKGSTDYLGITLPELAESHPYSDHLLIAIRALAIGKSSRLYRRLVEKEKICASIKVSSLCGVLPGVSIIMFNPIGKGHIRQIIEVFAQELYHLLHHDMEAAELELIKRDLINGWIYSFESMENTASAISAEEFAGDTYKLYNYDKTIEAIKLEEIRLSIINYWKAESLQIYYQSSDNKEWKSVESITVQDFVAPILNAKIKKRAISLKQIEDYANSVEHIPASPNSITRISESYYTLQLTNSLRVTYKHIPNKIYCGFAIASPVSQIMETGHNRGVNYLTTSAMLYGSKYHTYPQIQDISRQHGFNLRVIHHLDTTIFKGKCFIDDLPVALNILSEILLYPTFDNRYISHIKSSTMDNLRREDDYPVTYAFKLWQKMLCGTKTNLDNSSGSISQLKSLRQGDLRKWHESWNFPTQFNLSIVGSISPEEIYSITQKCFGSVPLNDYPPTLHQPMYQSSPKQLRQVKKNIGQAIINLGGFAGPASDVKQNTAFHILAQVIGGDLFSRMFKILREQYGFAYQTGFDFNSINSVGFWNSFVYCDPKDVKPSLKLLQGILKDICENGITADELLTAQNYLIGMNRFDSENVSWQASSIANLIALGYDLDHFLSREERIRNVTLSDIFTTANNWLLPEKHYIHILS
ncbi:MAG: peptidase M16 [Candidatus Cloacimonetes bacterium HGW-Cloacimonetes-1]|jgi:zinc protease|nr:MAG: peptidase M16 [Candidatus Cloacimonetes bacterium HGW-Cloacimonetes-1]